MINLSSLFQTDLALRDGSGYFFVNASVTGLVDLVFQESHGIVEVTASILH